MKLLKTLLYCFFVLCGASFSGYGQGYTFHHLRTDNGLSNSYVKSILKDRQGFLWIGTEAGLNRYDGYEFKVYNTNPANKHQIAYDDVYGLQEDGSGNIWIQGRETYMVYNRDKDNFINNPAQLLKKLGITPKDTTYKVHVDILKDLWVLDGNSLYVYNFRKKSHKKFNVGNATVTEMADDGENLYLCQNPWLIKKVNKHTGNQTIINLPQFIKSEIPNRDTRVFVDSRKGLFLFTGSSDAAWYYKNEAAGWKKVTLNAALNAESNIVLDVIDDENGNLWIGTDHKGLFIYNTNDGTITNITHSRNVNTSIAANNVPCLYKDNTGTIWMGHNKRGISYYNDSFHNMMNVDAGDAKDISIIMEDSKGNTWLGTDGNGLYMKNILNGGIIKMPIPNIAIVALEEDRLGRVWIGTYLNGLYCYENGAFKHYTKSNSSLVSNDIWSLKEDRYGTLWIGTLGSGLQYSTGKNGFNPITLSGTGLEFTVEMYYDGGDKLYAGTTTGLYIVDIATRKQTRHTANKKGSQKFRQVTVSNICKDDSGNLWLGHPKGMTLWDVKNDTLYYIDKGSGLSDSAIRGIVEDNHKQIWVTTSNGMSVLSAERNNKGIIQVSSRNFTTKDGLPDNYFNNHAICKLQNGDILVGGTEGYTVINPNKVAQKNNPLAKVLFTGLSLGNTRVQVDSLYNGHKLLDKPLWEASSVTLKHNDKLLSIYFTTGDLVNADKVRYAYKLEGFNNQWVTVNDNSVMFSSLAPGSYTLLVKASNSDGVWNNQPSVLHITVKPPFYLSILAICLYILIALAIPVVFFVRTRNHHLKKLERQTLQLQLDKEKSLNDMKLKFFTNISHDLRTPLTLITIPLQNILSGDISEGLRHKLNIINKNADQLMALINSLLDFRKLDLGAEELHPSPADFVKFVKDKCASFNGYAADRNINYFYNSTVDILPMQFDPVKMEKVLYNLLSNAFKYTPNEGSITVSVTKEESTVCVRVSDTGTGIKDEDKKNIFQLFYQASQKKENTGSGIGLHIVNEYVLMHGGTVDITDNAPQGSIFSVRLPIIETPAEVIYNIPDEEDEAEDIEDFADTEETATLPVLLMVDDNIDFCELIADSLSSYYTVLTAHNGFEALEKLQENDINLVISDVMMPEMDGIELCRRIKTNIEWSHIPVLLLTARTAEEYKIEGLEIGADDYLTKPFNFNLLRLRIQKFLEWTQRSHSAFSQKVEVSPAEITITSLDEHLIDKAIKAVEDQMSNPDFSVEELGAAVGLSRSHLYKKLMFITGKSPSEFIRTIKLKRSKELLEKSQLQIAEIAYRVGYNSPKRFTLNFKNEFGISPSDYLRSLKTKK